MIKVKSLFKNFIKRWEEGKGEQQGTSDLKKGNGKIGTPQGLGERLIQKIRGK